MANVRVGNVSGNFRILMPYYKSVRIADMICGSLVN